LDKHAQTNLLIRNSHRGGGVHTMHLKKKKNFSIRKKMNQVEYMIKKNKYCKNKLKKFIPKQSYQGKYNKNESGILKKQVKKRESSEGRMMLKSKTTIKGSMDKMVHKRYSSNDRNSTLFRNSLRTKIKLKNNPTLLQYSTQNDQKRNLSANFKLNKFQKRGKDKEKVRHNQFTRGHKLKSKKPNNLLIHKIQNTSISQDKRKRLMIPKTFSSDKKKYKFRPLKSKNEYKFSKIKPGVLRGGSPLARKLLNKKLISKNI